MEEQVKIKDVLFPIYNISLRWLQPCESDKEYSKWQTANAPSGMVFNSTDFYQAFREEPANSELDKIARDRWGNIKEKYNGNSPVIMIHFSENETWWITWFQHVTFDIGQSDEEVLCSFRRYVRRKQEQGRKDKNDSSYHLMGAEDEYRWHGAEPDGKPGNNSKAPCRCRYCKKEGVIRIAH